jgi:hypothetical protein
MAILDLHSCGLHVLIDENTDLDIGQQSVQKSTLERRIILDLRARYGLLNDLSAGYPGALERVLKSQNCEALNSFSLSTFFVN